MKFYLSSFRIGTESNRLLEITAGSERRVGIISNALDYFNDIEERKRIEGNDIADLETLGFQVEKLDLRDYFGRPNELKERVDTYDVVWVTGGNTFVLRQAMYLSGFDKIIKGLFEDKVKLVYGGFSAGICVLSSKLNGIHLVDDPNEKVYSCNNEPIWEGLDILNYLIVPHYRSSHFESEAIENVVQYMIENKLLFKVLRDGEVIVIE